MNKSGFNKLFKDGTGGLRAGGTNATKAMESSERRSSSSTNVWDDSVPVGYWDMSDGSGTKVSDVSSAGNDLSGTLKGTSDDYPDWDGTNKVRGSYSLLFEDGSSQASWTADNNVLDFNVDDSFSMSAWIKKISGTSTADASIMAKLSQYSISPDTDYEGYELYLKGGKQPTFLLYQDGSNYLWTHGGATDEIADTDWHHILVTYNGNSDLSGVKIYIDGSAASMTQSEDSLDTDDDIVTQTDFSIGARGLGRTTGVGTRNHFDGNIDEVAIWSKVLSTDEIADVYNSGAGNDLTDGIPKS